MQAIQMKTDEDIHKMSTFIKSVILVIFDILRRYALTTLQAEDGHNN